MDDMHGTTTTRAQGAGIRRGAALLAAGALALGAAACKEDQILYEYEVEPGTPLAMDPARAGAAAPPHLADADGAIPPGGGAPAAGQPPFMRNVGDGSAVDIAMLPRPTERDGLDPAVQVRRIDAPGVSFDLPADWPEDDVSGNPMRAHQFAIPGPDGPGELVVFHFGPGQGGDVAGNLNRWIGQIQLDPGTSPFIFQGSVNGLRVTELYTLGTLQPTGMGTGPTEPEPDSALFGFIVEGGPQGSLYIRATGPKGTLEAARPAFVTLTETVALGG